MFPQLFHRRSTAKLQEKADVNETLRTLIDARFDRIEAKVKSIELEWADVYDKIMHLYDRTRKRIKAGEKAPQEQTAPEPVQTMPTHEDVMAAWRQKNGAA